MEYTLLQPADKATILKKRLAEVEAQHYSESLTLAMTEAVGDSRQVQAATERLRHYELAITRLRELLTADSP